MAAYILSVPRDEEKMKALLVFTGLIAWFILQAYIMKKLGVSRCSREGCAVPRESAKVAIKVRARDTE